MDFEAEIWTLFRPSMYFTLRSLYHTTGITNDSIIQLSFKSFELDVLLNGFSFGVFRCIYRQADNFVFSKVNHFKSDLLLEPCE